MCVCVCACVCVWIVGLPPTKDFSGRLVVVHFKH